MSVSTRVGAALAAGYVLGRRRKLRLALIVASAMTNKNVRSSGLALLDRGTRGLSASPEVQKLGKQVTNQLAGAGKAAAIAVASSGIDQLSDRLSQRSARLRDEGPEDEDEYDEDEYDEDQVEDEPDEDEADEDDADDEPADEADEDDEDEDDEDEPADEADEDDEPKSRPRKRSTRRRAASSTGGAR